MHGTSFTGTQRTRRTSAGGHRTRALKNRLSRHWTPRHGAHRAHRCACLRACLCHRRDRPGRRSFVHRTRSSLRNDHARRRRLRRSGNYRRRRTRRRYLSLRRSGSCNRRRQRSNSSRGRCDETRRRGHRRRDWSRRSNRPFHHGSGHCRAHRLRRRGSRRRGNGGRSRRWRWSCGRRRRNDWTHNYCRGCQHS
jgi:hypothetical protein